MVKIIERIRILVDRSSVVLNPALDAACMACTCTAVSFADCAAKLICSTLNC